MKVRFTQDYTEAHRDMYRFNPRKKYFHTCKRGMIVSVDDSEGATLISNGIAVEVPDENKRAQRPINK